jgi:hypothetical protein
VRRLSKKKGKKNLFYGQASLKMWGAGKGAQSEKFQRKKEQKRIKKSKSGFQSAKILGN